MESDVKLELDNDMMKNLVSEAIMTALTTQQREALIQGAIKHLLTPSVERYGARSSPIEDAFQHAVRGVAEKIATEMLTNNEEVKTKIAGLLNEALTRLADTNREKTIERLADAITQGLAYRER